MRDGGGKVKIKIILHEAEEGGYWAEAPSIQGCVSQGETLDELNANLNEVVSMILEDEQEPAMSAEFVGTQTVFVA